MIDMWGGGADDFKESSDKTKTVIDKVKGW